MPLFMNTKLIAAKIEATVGTDAAPTGADAVLASNISFSPMEGKDEDRGLDLPYFGSTGTIPLDLHAKLSFDVEMSGSGTAGTAPAWGGLLRACAVAEVITANTSVVYNPITSAQESVTLHFFIEGTKFAMVGSRGNAKFGLTSSGVPKIMFEFTGLFVTPVENARPTPVYDDWEPAIGVTTANTPTVSIDATPLVMRSFELDLGNAVEPRFLVGSESVLITGKEDAIACQVEAVPLTAFDPFTLAATRAEVAVNIVHGKTAGNIITFNAPKAQMQRPTGITPVQDVAEWPLALVPQPNTGNDQWTLTLT